MYVYLVNCVWPDEMIGTCHLIWTNPFFDKLSVQWVSYVRQIDSQYSARFSILSAFMMQGPTVVCSTWPILLCNYGSSEHAFRVSYQVIIEINHSDSLLLNKTASWLYQENWSLTSDFWAVSRKSGSRRIFFALVIDTIWWLAHDL